MTNHRFSWTAFALAATMSLAGMLIAAQALARHPGAREPRQRDSQALIRSPKGMSVPVKLRDADVNPRAAIPEPPAGTGV